MSSQELNLIEKETSARFRKLSGISRAIQIFLSFTLVILGILYILGIHVYFNIAIFKEQWIGLFMSLFLMLIFLSVPASKKLPRDKVPWYDVLLVIIAMPSGIWLAVNYPHITMEMANATNTRVILGTIAIILLLEAGRRMVGTTLVFVGAFFLLYAKYSTLLPGYLSGIELTWREEINFLYVDANSTLNMLGLAATFGLAFVFFGQILLKFGGGDALTNVALLIFGKTRGGPAKAAIVGSSLVGTVTGAPMSNVFLTGSLTIPMMKRAGYPAHFAGAVEAVASSGGQIMPPVMGIAAFLIADRLGAPYAEVALAALVPAILFYIAVFVQVDLEAGKRGLRGMKKEEMPAAVKTIKEALPITLVLLFLIYLMFIARINPASAGIYTAIAAIPILCLQKESRSNFWKRMFQSIEGTARLLLDVGSSLAIAGLVIGSISISGLGFTFGYFLTLIGENSLLLLLIASAVGSIILGMGMPSVAAYALVAVLVGPAMVDFGVHEMAAHLFIFYFSIVSNFTPPIAVAAFAAAAIAGTGPMRTGWAACKLGVLAYIIPFLFVYSPTLILEGDMMMIVLSFLTAVIGTLFLGAGLIGYLFQRVPLFLRIILTVAGVLLLLPMSRFDTSVLLNAVGLLGGIAIFLYLYFRNKHNKDILIKSNISS